MEDYEVQMSSYEINESSGTLNVQHGKESIIMQALCIVTSYFTYPDDHLVVYRDIESICCAPGNNTVL